ncbi:competence protein, ComEA family [Aliarcobacter faecis]|uniref:ComEA family DNA-binding protein n=1 Tax=Aliarcobacter faecis TaxID=1564138 RepID=UPI00047A4801|nr:helix-hairpin-helix domain-containing protein [Aliarcobacter faecis]QKF72271.1 competence protein, ComEA family [Aliarcobacter faecis]
MKKILAILALGSSLLFGAINLQTASKEELMSIKGIGEKKADQIIEYRKTNKISKPEDLKNIKGFGDNVVGNVQNDVNVKDIASKKIDEIKEKPSKQLTKEKDNLEDKAFKKINKALN